MIVNQNSDFLFGFEATMTNANGDPDQENKPRMDYETKTALVSDARRKRDCRDFIKQKGYNIFVDTVAEKKVSMETMFDLIIHEWLEDDKFSSLLEQDKDLKDRWVKLVGNNQNSYLQNYLEIKKEKKKSKEIFSDFNNYFVTKVIKKSLIDIRWFGSAMAIEGITKTFTGPIQLAWGYSLHPVELVKSNSITTIMNDNSSTFGKKYKLYYALIAHYGTINKYNAARTGMTETDRDLFCKALVQGLMSNQTDSKQGQNPLFYIEIRYKADFDGYLGDLRRFLKVDYPKDQAIRSLGDLKINFSCLKDTIEKMKKEGYIDKVIGWGNPFLVRDASIQEFKFFEVVDLFKPIPASH